MRKSASVSKNVWIIFFLFDTRRYEELYKINLNEKCSPVIVLNVRLGYYFHNFKPTS